MSLGRRLAAAGPLGLIGAAAIWLARGFPGTPGHAYGPALFPTLLGAGLVLTAVLVALQAPPRAAAPPVPWRNRLAAAGVAVAPVRVILGFEAVGWPLLALGIGAALLLLAGARPLPALLVGLGISALTWVLFAMVLRVPLPRGPLSFLPY